MDLLDDLCGGDLLDEWFGVAVPVGGPEFDGRFELGDAGEHSAT